MRVGLDLLFLEPGRSGGRETYARELVRALRDVRPDLALVAVGGEELRAGGWWRACDDVVVLRGARASSRLRWARAEAVGVARAAARAGVDVLHATANFGPVVPRRAGRPPVVLTVHDVLFARRPDLVAPASRVPTAVLMRAGARVAERVVCVSDATAADARSALGVDGSRLVVVPNGVVPPPQPPGDARAGRAIAGVPEGMPLVLCVATHLPHKDLPTAVAAMAHVGPEARLVLAGGGTEALGGLGAVAPEALEHLYAAADALVLPTLFEGFGLPILEALARGVPVACSDLPVLREVAGEHASYFAPADAVAAGAAIVAALERGRGDAAAAEHARGFTWAAAATATAAVYDAAAAA